MFGEHLGNGWQFWVPPAASPVTTLLRDFQFRNAAAQKVVMSGSPPCVSVGQANQDPDNAHVVYTSDITNDYAPSLGGHSEPTIPAFVALWCRYLIAIAPAHAWTAIEVVNVANEALRDLLTRLGFTDDNFPTYLGVMADISANVDAACQRHGWTFPTLELVGTGDREVAESR